MIKNWYVLKVRTRQEIRIAKSLTEMGFTVYCPTKKEVRQYSDRKVTKTVPLFSAYIFIHLEETNRDSVFSVPGIERYLFWLGKPAVIRIEEMEAMRSYLEDDRLETVALTKFTPGNKMVLTQGAFKDYQATITEVGRKRVRMVIKGMGVVLNMKLRDLV